MMISQRLLAGVAVLALMGGCGPFGTHKPAPEDEDTVEPPTTMPVASTQPAEGGPDAATVQSLADKARAYAAQSERATTGDWRKPAPATVPSSASQYRAPAPVLPDVPIASGKDFQLRLAPPQDPAGPHPSQKPPVERAVVADPPPIAGKVVARPPSTAPSADDLEAKLQRLVKDSPGDVAAALDSQLLALLRGQRVPKLDSLGGLRAEDREVVTALLDAISNFRSVVRGEDGLLLAKKVRPLVEMADRLRTRSDLSVPTLALCKKVHRYGVYDPMERYSFFAGRQNTAVLYCEVENFSSQFKDGQQWETNLGVEVMLYNQRGVKVWSDKRAASSDLSRSRRHDYFLAFIINLPAGLPPGQYILKAAVTDQQVGRMAEGSLGIELAAMEK